MSRPAGGLSEIAAHWSEKKDKETPGWRGRQWRFTRGDVAEPLGGESAGRECPRAALVWLSYSRRAGLPCGQEMLGAVSRGVQSEPALRLRISLFGFYGQTGRVNI